MKCFRLRRGLDGHARLEVEGLLELLVRAEADGHLGDGAHVVDGEAAEEAPHHAVLTVDQHQRR